MSQKKAGPRGISADAVQAKTGKGWEEWFAILDGFNVPEHGHTLAAKHLRDEHGVAPWWAQAVTVRYEWERGLRTEPGVPETTDGMTL